MMEGTEILAQTATSPVLAAVEDEELIFENGLRFALMKRYFIQTNAMPTLLADKPAREILMRNLDMQRERRDSELAIAA
jgi:hypothetical protein